MLVGAVAGVWVLASPDSGPGLADPQPAAVKGPAGEAPGVPDSGSADGGGAVEAQPVTVMGSGTVLVPNSIGGFRRARFGFRADSNLGPAKGFLAVNGPRSHFSYSGTVRTVTVLETFEDGRPRKVQLTGSSVGRVLARFACTLGVGDAGEKGWVAWSIRGEVQDEVPLLPLFNGYLSME